MLLTSSRVFLRLLNRGSRAWRRTARDALLLELGEVPQLCPIIDHPPRQQAADDSECGGVSADDEAHLVGDIPEFLPAVIL